MHQKHPPANTAVAVACALAVGSDAVADNAAPSTNPASTAANLDCVISIKCPLLNKLVGFMTGSYAIGCGGCQNLDLRLRGGDSNVAEREPPAHELLATKAALRTDFNIYVAIHPRSCIVPGLQRTSFSQFGSSSQISSAVTPAFAFRNELQTIAIQLTEVFS